MALQPGFRFRLYVAGDSHNSIRAVANLTALCEVRLAGQHEIEIVDVFSQPDRALADGIIMTPTVIRVAPGPFRRVVGTLQVADDVVAALGLGPMGG